MGNIIGQMAEGRSRSSKGSSDTAHSNALSFAGAVNAAVAIGRIKSRVDEARREREAKNAELE